MMLLPSVIHNWWAFWSLR